ncbi:hypothetical protein FHG87_002133 [Trinorchestia longiramus]|nr:hypothetical protein FHG87_002133 [Trinorchestia longiramus]
MIDDHRLHSLTCHPVSPARCRRAFIFSKEKSLKTESLRLRHDCPGGGREVLRQFYLRREREREKERERERERKTERKRERERKGKWFPNYTSDNLEGDHS